MTQRVLNTHQSGCSAGSVVTWLVPWETAAVLAQVLCTPFNHAPVYCVHHSTMHQFIVYTIQPCISLLCTPFNHAPVYSVALSDATYIGCTCV